MGAYKFCTFHCFFFVTNSVCVFILHNVHIKHWKCLPRASGKRTLDFRVSPRKNLLCHCLIKHLEHSLDSTFFFFFLMSDWFFVVSLTHTFPQNSYPAVPSSVLTSPLWSPLGIPKEQGPQWWWLERCWRQWKRLQTGKSQAEARPQKDALWDLNTPATSSGNISAACTRLGCRVDCKMEFLRESAAKQ